MAGISEKVSVTSYGGISVLNAIPLGLGSTCAVDLKVDVTATYGPPNGNSRLTETIISYFQKETGRDFALDVKSQIPEGGGLKSSSAVATASIAALSRLTGLETDVPLLAAKLSLEAGVSVTGALDDATAAFYGGVSVCDNSKMKIIRRAKMPDGIEFVILPRGPRKDFEPAILQNRWPSFKMIAGLVMMGNYLEAMARNGLTVSEILGYETELLLRATKLGAKAAGVTGNGPSLFAAVGKDEEGQVIDLFSEIGKPITAKVV